LILSENICVIIPAYNVEDSIESVVRGALRHVGKVFVVDDGSTDATAEKAASAGADVLRIEVNRGKGHALKMLFERAGSEAYSAVISMDGDGQHDPEELPMFIAAHLGYPDTIIVGSRMHARENIPRARYNAMHIARFYISFASNQFIEDTQCGYRVYPLDTIKQMQLTQDRYVTESEILIKAGDMGRRIRFVRIGAIYGEIRSHFRPILDIAAITAYIISYFTYKFFVEGIFSDKTNTYKKGDLRDKIASCRRIDPYYQLSTVFMGFPLQSVYVLMHILLPVFIKNNFASTRRLDHGFFRITLGSYLLLVILVIIIFEKLVSYFGVKMQVVDGLIQTFYPNLWD